MKKIFIKKTLLVLAAFGVLFAAISCKNVSQPAESDSGTKVQEGPVLRIKASSGKKAVSKSNKKIIDSERTIKPESDITTFTDFVFYGKNVDDNDFQILGVYDNIDKLNDAEITLNKNQVSEDWTFKLTAMNGSAQYSGSTTVTLEDGDNEIFIILKNAEAGTGSFIVTVDFSAVGERAELADHATFHLYGDDDFHISETFSDINDLDAYPNRLLRWQKSNLPTGSYSLYVDIFTSQGALLATWPEGVIVNSGEVCEGTICIQYFDVLYNVTYELEDEDDIDFFAPMNQVSPSTEGINEPTRDGYIFTGWYTDEYYKNYFDKFITEDITLYGGWVSDSVSAADAADAIALIHGKDEEHPATLKITSTPSSDDIKDINTALRDNENTYFVLDLSGTALTTLDDDSFEYCRNLVGIELPDTLEVIGNNAFYNCEKLANIILPDSLEEIGEWAFIYCECLKSIVIPDNVTTIGNYAFSDCSALESVTIGINYSDELPLLFENCYNIKSVTIADGHPDYIKGTDGAIYSFDSSVLYWCPPSIEGESFTVSADVINIADYAFYDSSFKSIEIGKNVTSIGNHSFKRCKNLETITVDSENADYYTADDGVLLTKDGKKIVLYPAGKTDSSYTVPDTVEFIPTRVFYDAYDSEYLEEVILPDDGAIWYYGDYNNETAYEIMDDWSKFNPSNNSVISINNEYDLYKIADPAQAIYDYLNSEGDIAETVSIYDTKTLDVSDGTFTTVTDANSDKYFAVKTVPGKYYSVDWLDYCSTERGNSYINIPSNLDDKSINIYDGLDPYYDAITDSDDDLVLYFRAKSTITYIKAYDIETNGDGCLFRVRNNNCQVGDVLLNDGTIIPYNADNLSFTADQKAAAVGVLYIMEENGKPCGWLGIHNSADGTYSGTYAWAADDTTGFYTTFTDIQCMPSVTGEGAASTATFTDTDDEDGSDNWDSICSSDPTGTADAETNYPAFNYVNNYASNFNLTGDYATGWYMPSIAELCYIYRNKDILNTVLNALDAIQLSSGFYWSSSQNAYSNEWAWNVYFSNGELYYYGKYVVLNVCVVRSFDN